MFEIKINYFKAILVLEENSHSATKSSEYEDIQKQILIVQKINVHEK